MALSVQLEKNLPILDAFAGLEQFLYVAAGLVLAIYGYLHFLPWLEARTGVKPDIDERTRTMLKKHRQRSAEPEDR